MAKKKTNEHRAAIVVGSREIFWILPMPTGDLVYWMKPDGARRTAEFLMRAADEVDQKTAKAKRRGSTEGR